MGRKKRESTELSKAFSERLDDLIQKKKAEGNTQKEISCAIGVSSGILSEWASDQKTPGIDGLYKLSKYFAVSTDFLLGISDVETVIGGAQEAIDYTKLSERAVMRLHAFEDISALNQLSSMIENPIFFSILKDCAHFFARVKETQKSLASGEDIACRLSERAVDGVLLLSGMEACDYELQRVCDRLRDYLCIYSGYVDLASDLQAKELEHFKNQRPKRSGHDGHDHKTG